MVLAGAGVSSTWQSSRQQAAKARQRSGSCPLGRAQHCQGGSCVGLI